MTATGASPDPAARPRSSPHDSTPSTFVASVGIESYSSYDTPGSDGDLWPSCWADDDNVYTANGDGQGFGDRFGAIVVNRLEGTPETGLTGVPLASNAQIAPRVSGGQYYQKPTGMLAIDGDHDGHDELYLAVQDLNSGNGFNDAPCATVARSTDYGHTWQVPDEPMFTDHRFTTIMFLDFGRSSEHAAVLGPEASQFAYAYGLDWNWRACDDRTVPDPQQLYLARVATSRIQDRSAWEFFAGTRPDGSPGWTANYEESEPALSDPRRVYPSLLADYRPGIRGTNYSVLSQGGIVYNAPLGRYFYTSWTWYTFEFYEAPAPWGPWKLFATKDFGATPWFGCPPTTQARKEGGYATSIPSKFISDDGKIMWVQSNTNTNNARWHYGTGPANYGFSLRRLEIEPHHPTRADNEPDASCNLARIGVGVQPIEKSANHGRSDVLNDGETALSEDSFDASPKDLDLWGYTWARNYRFDRVVYTTGSVTPACPRSLTDDGRAIGPGGYSQFTLAIDPNNEGVHLVRRTGPDTGRAKGTVQVDGVEVARWTPLTHSGWSDQSVRLPASCTAGKSTITVRTSNASESAEFAEFAYWAQPIVWGTARALDSISIGPGSVESERAHHYEIVNPAWAGTTTYDQDDLNGGWFDTLTVQVRQDFAWVEVDGLADTPPYPCDETVVGHRSYTLAFAPTWGDGVRIIGRPGGSGHFTTISELEVYYAG